MPTGVAVAIPEGYAGFLQPRSGLALRHGVTVLNTPGLIDAGYRDELKVLLVNTDPHQPLELKVALAGIAPTSATGRLLTAPSMQAHNTFAAPDAVTPVTLGGVTLAGGALELRVPAMAVVIVELR